MRSAARARSRVQAAALARSRVLVRSVAVARALARCQLEAAEHTDSAAARFNLGVALGESGDLRGSIEAYEEALRLDADDADTHYNLALCYETLGPEGTERAIAAYRRTLALEPSADARCTCVNSWSSRRPRPKMRDEAWRQLLPYWTCGPSGRPSWTTC